MSPRFKTVLLITLGLLVVTGALLVTLSLRAQNPLRVRVTKVIPSGDHTVLRVEVRNDSRQTLWLATRWGVYEAGAPPPGSGHGISTDSLHDALPMVLRPGRTYDAGGTVRTVSLNGGKAVYYYHWQPHWQWQLEGYWWRVRSMFKTAPTSVYLGAQGKLGVAEIEVPKAP